MATLISKTGEFSLDFTDTAISKTQMKNLQKVFTDANKKFGKNAKISVNSIIPDEEKAAPKETAKTEQKEQKVEQKAQPANKTADA